MTIPLSESSSLFLNFIDYVRLLPTTWVFEHFLKKNADARKILSSNAIDDQVKLFIAHKSLEEQFDNLSLENQLLCALTYLFGENGLSLPQEKTGGLDDDLVRTFLVYTARSSTGEIRYFPFPEFGSALSSRCAVRIIESAKLSIKTAESGLWHGRCLNDVCMTAILADQGVLIKKKQGGLMRAAAATLHKLTHDTSPQPESSVLLDLLLEYGKLAGFLIELESQYRFDKEQFQRWLQFSIPERYDALVAMAGPVAGGFNVALFRAVVAQAGDGWLSSGFVPEKERPRFIEIVRMLNWLGIIELLKQGNALFFKQLTFEDTYMKLGAHAEASGAQITVLPDFSAVLSCEVDPEKLFSFGHMGVFNSLDRVYKARIDRDAMCDSLSRGVSGETMLLWLDSWQAPSNVKVTLKEWIREFNRLYVTDGVVLVSNDPKVTQQMSSFEALKEYLEPLPVHAIFRIKPGNDETVRNLLKSIGFDHRMPCRSLVETAMAPIALAAATRKKWEPITKPPGEKQPEALQLRGKKYGAGLKALDLNEMMHIIDYAVLTGQELAIEYVGSPLVKRGTYTIKPVNVQKGAEPILEGTLTTSGLQRTFLIRKIGKIGVGA